MIMGVTYCRANAFWQTEQLNGFSFVWDLIWRAKCSHFLKSFPQIVQTRCSLDVLRRRWSFLSPRGDCLGVDISPRQIRKHKSSLQEIMVIVRFQRCTERCGGGWNFWTPGSGCFMLPPLTGWRSTVTDNSLPGTGPNFSPVA